MAALTEELASALARVALANVTREYPRRLDHLLLAAAQDFEPKSLHPAFYGSYDWHSAVHMHWLLVRVLGAFPGLPEAKAIHAVLDRHLSGKSLAAELRYLQGPSGKTFERPYGWGWLLELHAELLRLGSGTWVKALRPLAEFLATRLREFVAAAPYPVRAGSHGNTAFACVLALDYARSSGNAALEASVREAALRWYGEDRNAPLAYEPSLDDFLSPALVEAVLMKQVLAAGDFARWLGGFLPPDLGPLAHPPRVTDRSDPKQSHLDGLALSRAWCFRRLGDKYAAAAERNLRAGLPLARGGDYAREHWLASFAALAMGDSP